ncbi:dephospho-CoA kinase [Anaerococcus prevotii]|uniref:Dephospho-CoA kinase n=1 Tax=Anaerococcus prevotii ACS-065-V-Col13 TaxID=879305 RepID=F0GVQ4_9FIRM|nr:dephospho-CoA kinase [Anaerococcus prevotii]EGC82130.1 dephospho-CoA kinase [Anaerococcus prevotii ACS-065-V-Col13]
MNPSRIVITGLIASGKSTLAEILREEGFVVIDADKVNKKLIEEDGTNYLAIKSESDFKDAFDGDRLDKNKLGQIIFSDPKKMEKLNSITHKNIIREIEKEIESVDEKAVFIEIPLYFQMKEKFENDGVILVTCKKDVQIKRLMARDKISESFAKKKIESQDTLAYMVDNSDIIIDNSGDEEELRIKIKNMLDRGNY